MKNKILLFIFLFSTLITPVQSKIIGYVSLDFVIGQEQSDVSKGSFQNSQAGLLFFDDISPSVSYLTEFRFKPEGTVDVEQAWISFGTSEAFALNLGLYLVPFGRYNQSSRPHQTLLISPPLNVERMYPFFWRDVGVLLEGKTRRFFYSAFLGNGLSEDINLSGGQQFKDNNKDKGKGGRVGLVISQGFEIAYSYYRSKYDEDNSRDLLLQGVDLFWYSEGVLVHAEYSKARMEIPDDTGNAEGFFIQIALDMGQFRPVACYQQLDYEDGFHGPGFVSPDVPGSGISEKKRRWALGFAYQASQNLLLKFEYNLNSEKGVELKNDSLSVQVAFSF
jgi:hypothetical protein